jgi:hypothetical protein
MALSYNLEQRYLLIDLAMANQPLLPPSNARDGWFCDGLLPVDYFKKQTMKNLVSAEFSMLNERQFR